MRGRCLRRRVLAVRDTKVVVSAAWQATPAKSLKGEVAYMVKSSYFFGGVVDRSVIDEYDPSCLIPTESSTIWIPAAPLAVDCKSIAGKDAREKGSSPGIACL